MKLGPLLLAANLTPNAGNVTHVLIPMQLRDIMVQFIYFTVVTDATVATRQPYIQAVRGQVQTAFYWLAHSQAASLTLQYIFAPHVSNFSSGTFRGTAAQPFWLPAGCELRLTLATGQAGDTHGVSNTVFQEVLQW